MSGASTRQLPRRRVLGVLVTLGAGATASCVAHVAGTRHDHVPLPSNAYLLKLFEPVPELDFSNRAGFGDSDHDGQLCGSGD